MSNIKRKNYLIEKNICAFSTGNLHGMSVTIDGENTPQNGNGERVIKEGTFVSKVAGEFRFTPIAKTETTLVPSVTTTIQVNPVEVFKVGDVISLLYGLGKITFTTTPLGANVRIALGDYLIGFTTVSSTVAAVVAQALEVINSDPVLKGKLFAVSNESNSIFLQNLSDDLVGIPLVFGTGNGVTGTIDSVVKNNYVSLGTISSIDCDTKTITLQSAIPNIGATLPVGVTVGIPNQVVGLVTSAYDFADKPRQNISVLTQSSGVFIGKLPYYDEYIGKKLPQIIFGNKF
jgi:hypothetical protein